MKISAIYQIVSKAKPDRKYIGSALDVGERWNRHLRKLRSKTHHSKNLQKHFDKYGESDLQLNILLGCDVSDLLKIEQYYIDSYNPYFNMRKTALSSLGRKHSELTKKLISKIGKGTKHNYPKARVKITNETIEKIRNSNTGKKRSAETCKRISESRKGLNNGLLRGWSGYKHTDATKAKMSLARKKYHQLKKVS